MTRTTEIYKTEFQAIKAAKWEFSKILNISPNSIRTAHDKYYEQRYGSTQCVCGETSCCYFKMSNAGKKQQSILDKAIDRPGAVLAFGVCESCGIKF